MFKPILLNDFSNIGSRSAEVLVFYIPEILNMCCFAQLMNMVVGCSMAPVQSSVHEVVQSDIARLGISLSQQ